MKLDHFLENDLNVEVLFHDHLVVVTGKHTVWARRRRIYLADLSQLPWLLPPKETWTHGFVADAFRKAPAQYVESQFDDLRVAACHAFSLAGLVHYSVAEFGCIASFGNQSPEGIARRYPGFYMARGDRNAQGTHIESCSGAVYRMFPGSRQIARWPDWSTDGVGHKSIIYGA
jgi:DNA-binding transcriptional LysR family regulator